MISYNIMGENSGTTVFPAKEFVVDLTHHGPSPLLPQELGGAGVCSVDLWRKAILEARQPRFRGSDICWALFGHFSKVYCAPLNTPFFRIFPYVSQRIEDVNPLTSNHMIW